MLPVNQYMRTRIWSLTWPVILDMSGQMLAGTLVTAMVGHLGAVSLAAVSLALMMQIAATLTFAAAGTGAAAIISREAGACNYQAVRSIAGQAVMLAAILGTILAACGYASAAAIFTVLDADAAVAGLASDLLRMMFLFTPVLLIMAVSNFILRAVGRTIDSFWVSMLNNGTNIVVSYFLINGIGLPRLEAFGAAWGTVLGQTLGGTLAVIMLMRTPLVDLRFSDIFTFRQDQVKRILRVSIPAALEQAAMQGGRIVFTFLLVGVGTVQFAAHQIAMQVESISFLPGFGFSVAAMTLVGISLGQGLPHRAARFVKLTRSIGFCLMSLMGAIFFFFSEQLTALFIKDPEVLYWGSLCVKIAAVEQPTLALNYVMGGALRGAGDTKWPMYVTTVGIWLVRLPLIYLCITIWKLPITVAWWITAADFLVRSAIMWWRFETGRWNKAI
ncbi:MATE family efflux transporter [Sporomusa aerivorans]|uniref:MATE family efflux transporter n=1 Tax=Sporomusa aerivorans TaxID=204936 RepID=UPI00352A45B1